MVTIPAGWFWMGQDDGIESNQPQHRIYLDSYEIDRTEVTNAAFDLYVKQSGILPKRGWDESLSTRIAQEPVIGIIWAEAGAYCRWAGKRLPTEAEWEKAARGEDALIYPWGNAWDPARANTRSHGQQGVLPVGSFAEQVSPYGLYDMIGNAAEWVADYYDPAYYSYSPQSNPAGAVKILDHGMRGGSWDTPDAQATSYFRDSSHSVKPNFRVGFRCAR